MVGIIYILTPSSSHLLNSMCCECVQVHKQGEKGQTDTRRRVVPICVYILSTSEGVATQKAYPAARRRPYQGYIGAEPILTTTQLVTTPSTVRPF